MADHKTRFKDRQEAGRLLADGLPLWRDRADAVVLGLPRGGVVVASALSLALHLPLDMVLVRKLGVPSHPEFALGAIASVGGAVHTVLSDDVIAREQISDAGLEEIIERESAELLRRENLYRTQGPPLELRGQHVMVTDDGIATGSTMLAALSALRAVGVASITVAVPVASREALRAVGRMSDALVCLNQPEPFYAVGHYYDDFAQTSDAEVLRLLRQAQPLREGYVPSHQTVLKHKGDHRGL